MKYNILENSFCISRFQPSNQTHQQKNMVLLSVCVLIDLRTTWVYPRQSATLPCLGTGPESGTRRALLTRSGSARRSVCHATPEPSDKPSGKRKFKSKHLGGTEEEKVGRFIYFHRPSWKLQKSECVVLLCRRCLQ